MIQTKASLLKQKEAEKTFQAVKFENVKKLPKTKPPTQKFDKSDDPEDEEFNKIFGDGGGRNRRKDKNKEVTFDGARREILNFGLSGKSVNERSNQTELLLIKLGAKPTKRKGVNYKELLEEKKKQKLQDASINKRTLFGTSASLQYQGQKRSQARKKDEGLLKRYGRVEKSDKKKINNKKR